MNIVMQLAKATLRATLIAMVMFKLVQAAPVLVSVTDPVGDSTGPVDVIGMDFEFNNETGNYTILLTATDAEPFAGDFRVNINLFNLDVGTTADDPSYFQDTINDFSLLVSSTAMLLSGTNSRLLSWDTGDRILLNNLPDGTPHPDGGTLFSSVVSGRPSQSLEKDVIGLDKEIAIVTSMPLAAGSHLESPRPGSFESGIGLIRGWACEADHIDVLIDGVTSIELPYGTSRPDTAGVCGDADNGFGGVVNWNLFGDGQHEIRAFVDSVEFASATFTVTTLGVEFLTGAAGDFFQTDFPDPGRDLTLRWSEPHQNFVFVGTGTGTGAPDDTSGDGVTAWLESPFSGSSESGIGLIRGWACNASDITVMIDADPPIATSHGAERPDTVGVCGDSDNGFGIVVNWNRYPSGVHRLRAFADASPTPFADGSVNVFNIRPPDLAP